MGRKLLKTVQTITTFRNPLADPMGTRCGPPLVRGPQFENRCIIDTHPRRFLPCLVLPSHPHSHFTSLVFLSYMSYLSLSVSFYSVVSRYFYTFFSPFLLTFPIP